MNFTVGVVLFAVALGLSVAIHEFGHLLTAKAFGMKAERYFIGFGPKIFSFRRGETEYGLKAIPAGGFVKIAGFTHLEEVAPADEPRAFWRFAAWKRLIVLAAGSFTHFLIAFVILYFTAIAIGLPTNRAIVGEVSRCVPASEKSNTTVTPCPAGVTNAPAYLAGLHKGDRIVALDGAPVTGYDALVSRIRARPGQEVQLTYIRDGVRRTTSLRLASVQRPPQGGEAKNAAGLATVGAIGIAGAATETYGPGGAFAATARFGGSVLDATFGAIGRFPGKVPSLVRALEGQKRDPNGPVSVVGASRIGGQAVAAGSWLLFLFLLASFNIFIGVFNLFPLLPLDGGHIAVLIFEKIRAWFARLHGRADPGRVDMNKLMPATFVVILLFGGISVLTIIADIVNPIANPFRP
ncbi:MAG TPA: site-2 protease family protein [Mycobacteriales bacterium]|jgi:membrane-associated protease RseP (regulator of RpoE activity)